MKLGARTQIEFNRARQRCWPGTLLSAACGLGVLTWACSEPADTASPSDSNDDEPLPIPARPAPNWNCGDRCWREASIPAEAQSAFTSTVEQVDLQPELVYPLDGAVHPTNLTQLAFQFRRQAPEHRWFNIRLSTSDGALVSGYNFFVPCNPPSDAAPADQCLFNVPSDLWRSIAEDNAGRLLTLSVGATSESAGNIHRSPDYSLVFSGDPIAGGFYYWSTALGGTYRLPFGAEQAVPWIAPNSASNPSTCGGCHAVSRNGSVIAFTSDAAAGYLQVADAADPTQKRIDASTTRNSSMLALSSDGARVIMAYDGRLTLKDTQTDTMLAEADQAFFGAGRTAYFPEFSADDSEVVVTLSDAPDSFWSVVTGEIAILPLAGDRFGEPRVVASTPEQVHFYPTWSPDSQWLIFASAPVFSLSYDQPNARLCAVHRDGGPVYELANATQGIGNTSTLPKFAPFIQADGAMFFTFNSKLDYGFLLNNSRVTDPAQQLPQLWLSTFDPTRVGKSDPSSAPLWLPFQSVDQRNHLGLWTERVSCGDGSQQVSVCGPSEICIDNSCHVVR